jgi:hypothetical protein
LVRRQLVNWIRGRLGDYGGRLGPAVGGVGVSLVDGTACEDLDAAGRRCVGLLGGKLGAEDEPASQAKDGEEEAAIAGVHDRYPTGEEEQADRLRLVPRSTYHTQTDEELALKL